MFGLEDQRGVNWWRKSPTACATTGGRRKTEKGRGFNCLPATESPSSIRFCDWPPAPVRVEAVDALDDVGRFRPEVFFVDHSVMAHHKALNPGDLVICRIGYKCKAADHCAFLHKVQFA